MTFTAVSEVAAARLRPALAPGVPVRVLHNGIDPSAWQVRHRPTGEFSILSVGRLAPRKRPLVLVETLARFAAVLPELRWHATFVGDGSQYRHVARAVHAYGLQQRVALVGAQTRAEIRDHLAGADVLVAPATLESFGIAALEARCAGVPIVGMASSGLTEFVTDGVDGLLARSDHDLVRCLTRLATHRALARSIREHNTTVPVAMSWDAVLEEHDAVYDSVLARAGIRA
jgi:glycosyltransferase involved in cell wall biosynthesis